MTQIYANIGHSHENDIDLLKQRVVAAAECNADAVIINKSTPHLVIPEDKKYVALDTPWGTLPYIDLAKRSEISFENAEALQSHCDSIGIPIIWSVTDTYAAEFVVELGATDTIKLHNDTVNDDELVRYCIAEFEHCLFNVKQFDLVTALSGTTPRDRQSYSFYYTTDSFPPELTDLKLSTIDQYTQKGFSTGYEGREPGIFPALALGYRGVSHIEKYLGEPDSDMPSILTPAQFYDLFNSVHTMEQAE